MLRGAVLVLPGLVAAAQAVATCYKADGTPSKFFPCNPDAAISPCCNDVDFCMSNGMCLNGGDDNGFTLQGCTDQNWRAPCTRFCNGPIDEGGFVHLWMCGMGEFCCGTGAASCCSNGTAALFTALPASAVSRPGGIPSTSTTTSGTGTQQPPPTQTSQTRPGDSTNTAKPGGGQSEAATGASPMTVGLGVGIPLGLALVAALALLAWQTRRLMKLQSVAADDARAYYKEAQPLPPPTFALPVELPEKTYQTHELADRA